MNKWMRYFVLFVSFLMVAACSPTENPVPEVEEPPVEESSDNGNQEEPEEEPTEPEVEYDAQIEDTIEIEGMEEPITLNLYQPQDAPFVTYVPEDLLAEEASGSEGTSHWFYANYNDEKLEDIYLQLYLFAADEEQPTADDPDSTYGVMVEGMELQEENTYYDWAIEEYQSPNGSNITALGEQDGQYYLVSIRSNPQFSEGFYPRTNKVLEHLEWIDN